MKATSKYKIGAVSHSRWNTEANNGKGGMATKIVYIGYTERQPDQYLREFKSAIKTHPETYSKKIQDLRVNAEELSIQQLCMAFGTNLAATVNKYIDKHDTIHNGWNTEYRV